MAGKHMKQAKHEAAHGKKRSDLLVGGAVVALLAFGCAGLFTGLGKTQEPPKDPQQKVGQEITGIGILDLAEVFEAHPRNGEYRRLKAEYENYAQQVERLSKREFSPGAALPGDQAFEDAARQKHMQETIRKAIVLEKRLKEAEADYRTKTEADLKARVDEIEGDYQNAIFNLQLKLDNASALRLNEAGIRAISNKMAALKLERRQRSVAIRRQYEDQVQAYVNEVREKERKELGLSARDNYQLLKQEEARRESEAINRNIDALQKGLEADLERLEKLPAARKNLRVAQRELSQLEAVMEHDISSLAAKYAVIHKLEIVLVKSPKPAGIIDRISGQDGKKFPAGCDIITDTMLLNGFDVTKEVAAELKKS